MNKKFVYQVGNNKKVINLCCPYITLHSKHVEEFNLM